MTPENWEMSREEAERWNDAMEPGDASGRLVAGRVEALDGDGNVLRTWNNVPMRIALHYGQQTVHICRSLGWTVPGDRWIARVRIHHPDLEVTDVLMI